MWSLFHRNAWPAKPARRTLPSVRPRLEALEDRCLLSGGSLDPTFGTGGLVNTPIGSGDSSARAVISQPDGKIVAGGYSVNSSGVDEFTLARYNTNGTLDSSFGHNGIVQTAVGSGGSFIDGLALQSDGKIVAVGNAQSNGGSSGTFDFAVVRYNPNGSLDTSFGSGKHPSGIVLTNMGSANSGGLAAAVAIDGNGKIDVAGYSVPSKSNLQDFTVARYNSNGTLDTTFGSSKNGIVTTQLGNTSSQAYALAIQPSDGKILVAGEDNLAGVEMAVVRYTTTGQLDSTFGTNGIVTGIRPNGNAGDQVNSVLVLGNGSIVLGGSTSYVSPAGQNLNQLALVQLTSTGQINTSFGSSGFAFDNPPGTALGSGSVALGLGANGDLMAGMTQDLYDSSGNFTQEEPAVAAFLSSGALDTTFGSNGTAVANFGSSWGRAWAMTIQGDGKIVVAGDGASSFSLPGSFNLVRFLASAPQIGSFAANPNPVTSGSSTTLTASNITDGNPGATITQVAFYLDSNNDGTLEPGSDTLLGYATETSPGVWTFNFTVNLTAGTYTLFAQAEDNYGVFSDPDALTLTVQ